jgi:hypothetical protein
VLKRLLQRIPKENYNFFYICSICRQVPQIQTPKQGETQKIEAAGIHVSRLPSIMKADDYGAGVGEHADICLQ